MLWMWLTEDMNARERFPKGRTGFLPAFIKNGGNCIMKVLVTGVKGQLGYDVDVYKRQL